MISIMNRPLVLDGVVHQAATAHSPEQRLHPPRSGAPSRSAKYRPVPRVVVRQLFLAVDQSTKETCLLRRTPGRRLGPLSTT